jgi:hypothetical protein
MGDEVHAHRGLAVRFSAGRREWRYTVSDLGHLQTCFSGDAVRYARGCGDTDFDGDLDVDAADVSAFLDCMRGPGMPGGC